MSQMGPAVCTLYLCSNAVSIWQSLNRSGDFIVKNRPPTVCLELAFRTIESGTASFANVSSAFPEGIVFAGERRFCTFINNDFFFFLSQFTIFLFFFGCQKKSPNTNMECPVKNQSVMYCRPLIDSGLDALSSGTLFFEG